ncbi:unnamed protein product [Arabidopsis thaliana]|uniref:Defensin-like protein 204 n=5 Tax=Arabidopsis TaxID=3701 RepID=DF204_ARATH|nr:S locus-related glycoprotein 1 (SLR1) binding pollen coat protein family [Arabidopsis thaliana]Q56XB0.1 RecName: Full=Defensin-like protein 204; Flags: Precursor [Arabidopsis thaliana]KAG7624174.1 hypothetical protein ISN45_At03g005470 [Arabidopsis thaliana x Arabidopsis arenosa]KAG7630178.1 hypothetical protein ISN44_As03g005440 [Arabidopsis suecica]AEE74286.1 S locus-related glycoprotein 1 (SLR1) binding pollen coat protein family [Arabidopsis thaliana]OAP04765.1 hypothetical protein AXX1|eukprot:NP_001030645.1 S locus-related glycoprotein 1 (SLR1) binding pollen coat protein family [Arabidopsis thaliana]
MAKTFSSICFTTLLLVVLFISTEIPKSEAHCDHFLGEAPVYPCKEKACKSVCKEHYHHACKGECEYHGREVHCHCYGDYH